MAAQGSSLNQELVRKPDVSSENDLRNILVENTPKLLSGFLSCTVCSGSSWDSDAASETPPLVQDSGCKKSHRMKKERTELEGSSIKEEVSQSFSNTIRMSVFLYLITVLFYVTKIVMVL